MCTRATYLGPENTIITGRSMDWKEDIHSNIYIFPCGINRKGAKTSNTITWTSKYGSVITTGYDMATADGMNEKGLVANLLYLTESSYDRINDSRPVMGLSIWTQYVLDNFATVSEAVETLKKDSFKIDAPPTPTGEPSRMHLAISDSTGNSAIIEYIEGKIVIHQGKEYQIMTNSPVYDKQLTLNNYWKQIGGLVMLPGTNRASDRFVRASFYIDIIPQTSDYRMAVAGVFSVIRNTSVPLGISTPSQPNIASTRWRTVSDQKNLVYYFESTTTPNIFWIDLKKLSLDKNSYIMKLSLSDEIIYTGNTINKLQKSKSFNFLFRI